MGGLAIAVWIKPVVVFVRGEDDLSFYQYFMPLYRYFVPVGK